MGCCLKTSWTAPHYGAPAGSRFYNSMQTVLSVDIGTSSLKAALINEKGQLSGYGRCQFLLKSTEHAAREWEAALKEAVAQIQQTCSCKPDAVCISGNGPTLVSTDGSTLLWNEETPFTHKSSLFIPRLLAFKKKYPSSWQNLKSILSGPEYLIYRLTGKSVTILPEKRFQTAYWNDEMLYQSGLSEVKEKLPSFVSPGTMAGTLNEEFAKKLCLPQGTPCYTGAPDFVSALVGTATLSPGRLCDRAGSSEGLNLCTSEPFTSSGIRTLPSVIDGLWNASVLLPRSGSCFSEMKLKLERQCGHEIAFSELVDSLLQEVHSAGSRESLSQEARLLLQIASSIKKGVELLKENAALKNMGPITEMTVTGGQSLHSGWNQFKADLTGLKVNVLSIRDAELLGDAVFAFTGMGLFASLTQAAESLCRIEKTFIPASSVNYGGDLFDSL